MTHYLKSLYVGGNGVSSYQPVETSWQQDQVFGTKSHGLETETICRAHWDYSKDSSYQSDSECRSDSVPIQCAQRIVERKSQGILGNDQEPCSKSTEERGEKNIERWESTGKLRNDFKFWWTFKHLIHQSVSIFYSMWRLTYFILCVGYPN